MFEAAVTTIIAALTGLGYLNTRLHSRIQELDNRINAVELRVVEKYVPREELLSILDRFEDHMVRIEQKLDNLQQTIKYN